MPGGRSRKGSSLKFTTKTSSSGLESFTSATDAASTFARLSRMLPLLSITRPIETGTSSALKTLISWGAPFSVTLNALFGKPVTRWPALSITDVWHTTSRVSARKITPGSSTLRGVWCCA